VPLWASSVVTLLGNSKKFLACCVLSDKKNYVIAFTDVNM